MTPLLLNGNVICGRRPHCILDRCSAFALPHFNAHAEYAMQEYVHVWCNNNHDFVLLRRIRRVRLHPAIRGHVHCSKVHTLHTIILARHVDKNTYRCSKCTMYCIVAQKSYMLVAKYTSWRTREAPLEKVHCVPDIWDAVLSSKNSPYKQKNHISEMPSGV